MFLYTTSFRSSSSSVRTESSCSDAPSEPLQPKARLHHSTPSVRAGRPRLRSGCLHYKRVEGGSQDLTEVTLKTETLLCRAFLQAPPPGWKRCVLGRVFVRFLSLFHTFSLVYLYKFCVLTPFKLLLLTRN